MVDITKKPSTILLIIFWQAFFGTQSTESKSPVQISINIKPLLLQSILMTFINFCCLFLCLLILLPRNVESSVGSEIHKIPLRYTNNYLYYATLAFGSQKQNMEVQLDTGSRTMAVFCDICKHGCALDQQFKTSQSSTFKSITCGAAKAIKEYLSLDSEGLQKCLQECKNENEDYQCVGDRSYGSGALGSYLEYDLAFEIIGINNTETRVPSTFGCIYDQVNFDQGIWGLSISPTNEFLDSIYEADKKEGLNPKKVISICTNGTDSVLNIGGIDPTYHISEGITVNVKSDSHSWWQIKEEDIGRFKIDGHIIRELQVPLGKKGIILDSGADTIVLPIAVETAIREKIDSLCDAHRQLCLKGEKFEIFERTYIIAQAREFFSSLPPLQIQLGEKILETPISNYFWKVREDVWALGIVQAEKFGFNIGILGSTWMNNFDIAFDREQKTISIYDITRCSPSGRRLQSQSDETNDPYELPQTRESSSSYESIKNLKKKHSNTIEGNN